MKRLFALILALSLLLSACGSNSTGESTSPPDLPTESQQESPEDTSGQEALTEDSAFGLSYLPQYGLNPFTCTAIINRALFSLLYESLFVVNGDFTASPVLCQSFESSADGTFYRFRLVEGVRFSDGTPLTAQDVQASILAAKNSSLYASRLDHVSSVYVAEDGSLEISLDTAYENFALMLDVPVVKASTVDRDRPTGTGPYRYQSRSLVKNSHWWKEEHGVLTCDEIALSTAQESNDLRNQFEFGSTDLVYSDPNSTAAVGYRCDYEVWESPTTIMHYLGFNLSKGWFTNPVLRSAITYAIDRDAYVNEVYGGFAQATALPCSPASPFYDEQLAEDHDYAPGKFKEALDTSGVLTDPGYEGYQGKFLVCLDDPARVKLADRICKVLTDAGLTMTVTALEKSQYEEALENLDFDVYLGEVRLTANFDLIEFFRGSGNLQYGYISDSGLEGLCSEALANSGRYSELYLQLLTSAPICPVVFKSYAIYVTRGKITNNQPGVDLVFHDGSQARSLSDAYETPEEE